MQVLSLEVSGKSEKKTLDLVNMYIYVCVCVNKAFRFVCYRSTHSLESQANMHLLYYYELCYIHELCDFIRIMKNKSLGSLGGKYFDLWS